MGAATRVTFYGGVDEIGGNKFLLETGRTRVFLDFGLSFHQHKRFFAEFLKPRKFHALGDLWALGLLPRIPGLYRQDYLRHMGLQAEERAVDGVVVTHAHMDHIGDIPYLREDIPVLASPGSFGVMEALEDTGPGPTSEYLALKPSFQFTTGRDGEARRLRDADAVARPRVTYGPNEASVGDVKVRGVAEDHSLPGAAGILLEAADKRIAYTGDFRFHGRHGERSWAFVDQAAAFEPDVLFVEGTRVTEDEQPGEADVARELQRGFEAARGLVVANWPIRDTDRLLSFHEAAKRAGRALCVSMKQAYFLQRLRRAGEEELPSLDDKHLRIYVPRKDWGLWGREDVDPELALADYREWERALVGHRNAITAEEVREDPEAYAVRVDFFELKELIDLRPPSGSLYLRSTTEPFDDQMEIQQEKADAWLRHFGLEVVHKHASGHASGPELWKAVERIAPRAVVPIHTEHPELFGKHLAPLGIEVRRPSSALLPGGKPMVL